MDLGGRYFNVVLCTFLLIGFPFKILLHRNLFSDSPYINPVGNFPLSDITEGYVEGIALLLILAVCVALHFPSRGHNMRSTRPRIFQSLRLRVRSFFTLNETPLLWALLICYFFLILVNIGFDGYRRGVNYMGAGVGFFLFKAIFLICLPTATFFLLLRAYNRTSKLLYPLVGISLITALNISINSRAAPVEILFLILIPVLILTEVRPTLRTFATLLIFAFIASVSNVYISNYTRFNHFNSYIISLMSAESKSRQDHATDNSPEAGHFLIERIWTYGRTTIQNVGYYSLIIDRFVGIEPVLAVLASESRSHRLFIDGLSERKGQPISFYDAEIAYRDTTYFGSNKQNTFYHNLPGIIAFSLYTDNLFLSVAFCALVVILYRILVVQSERISREVSWVVGYLLAYRLSHFGYAPLDTFYYSLGVALIGLLLAYAYEE